MFLFNVTTRYSCLKGAEEWQKCIRNKDKEAMSLASAGHTIRTVFAKHRKGQPTLFYQPKLNNVEWSHVFVFFLLNSTANEENVKKCWYEV